MPIQARYKWLYPFDWPQLSALVRFERAQDAFKANFFTPEELEKKAEQLIRSGSDMQRNQVVSR